MVCDQSRNFRQAATKYLDEATKASIGRDAELLTVLDPFIGNLTIGGCPYGRTSSLYGE